jgi:hypothetical protein
MMLGLSAMATQIRLNSTVAPQTPGHAVPEVSLPQACSSGRVGQLLGTTCWQLPLVQKSKVEGCPSSQRGCVQLPLPSHTSPVQGLRSSGHGSPAAMGVWTHPPAPSQAAVVHGLLSGQAAPCGMGGWAHAPAPSHASVVQGLPSSGQAAPWGAGVCWQPVDGWQLSTVQALPSSHIVGSSNRHFPVLKSHRLTVQPFPSSHIASLMHSTAQVHPPARVLRSSSVVSPCWHDSRILAEALNVPSRRGLAQRTAAGTDEAKTMVRHPAARIRVMAGV